MKKLLIISLSMVLTLGLAACGTPPPQSSAPSISVLPSPSPSPSTQPNESSSSSEKSPPPIPADAAMYRGTVTEIISAASSADSKTPQTTEVTLEQAEGTDFGAPTLKFAFTADTKADFVPEKGQYLEVYYGTAPGQPLDTEVVHNIITAIRYNSAEMVNFNGYIKAINPSADPARKGSGRIIMVPTLANESTADKPVSKSSADDGAANPNQAVTQLPSTDEIHYNYDEKTNFYLNFDELKVGDRLNIFQSGAMAMSMPPQCYAIEVRKYAAAK